MKQVITYEAFDGTIFENIDECKTYEKMRVHEKIDSLKSNPQWLKHFYIILEQLRDICTNIDCNSCPWNDETGCLFTKPFHFDIEKFKKSMKIEGEEDVRV